MPTTIKDSTNFMRNVNNKLRKITAFYRLSIPMEIKTTWAKLLSKGFDFEFYQYFTNQNR
jgi:hypothetical protein